VRALESVRIKPNAVCFLSRDKCLVELADFYGEGDRATATGGDASGNQIMMGSELWTAESAAASESNRPSLVSCDLCMQVTKIDTHTHTHTRRSNPLVLIVSEIPRRWF
jgi:hypothetical protein